MKTLADVKRRAQVGALVRTHFPTDPFGKGDPPVRKIVRAQSNAIVFEATEWSHGDRSWLYWPPAATVGVEGDTFTLRDAGVPIVYTFVDAS